LDDVSRTLSGAQAIETRDLLVELQSLRGELRGLRVSDREPRRLLRYREADILQRITAIVPAATDAPA
jgi:hypothetical protein